MVDYAAAGVDIEAGDRAVELMKASVAASHNDTVVGGAGGFAGLIDASALVGMRRPLLASSTDGVGTKVAVAQALDIHHTIGQDLVAMVVDDIVVTGARPLLMTDYIACGKVVPEKIADIVRGIADACAQTDCPLVGGETAEHPGLMAPEEYDVAGAAVGVVEADEILGQHLVEDGDILIALPSSGLHSNGYSLVRRIIADAGWQWDRHVPQWGRTVGEELLEPTRLYTRDCLQMVNDLGGAVHAFSHITGGGLGANISRVIPSGMVATIERDSWQVPAVFSTLAQLGQVPWEDMEQTLNLGVGMVAVVDEDSVSAVVETYEGAWVLGQVKKCRELPAVGTGEKLVQGAKGVDAGAAWLRGEYRLG
ncbi:MAG: phosphoribosylformylglycinamidine cyclo-ligase [Actinomycetaceae bacterium]|nr:phosphoribosylformylglycinamidine cyclo-ligase [Actinomycetaceae bacterium]